MEVRQAAEGSRANGAVTLPSLNESETIFSWAAKARHLAGWSARRSSLFLFGTTRASAGLAVPVGIAHLTRLTAGSLGSAERLISRHTGLGAHLAFLSRERRDAAIADIEANLVTTARMRLGMRSDRSTRAEVLRLCQSCVEEDLAELGYSRWLTVHQLPGAWVCTKHGLPLCSSASRVSMSLPHEIRVDDPRVHDSHWRDAINPCRVLALLANMAARQAEIDSAVLKRAVVDQLTRRGIVKNPSRLNLDSIYQSLLNSSTARMLQIFAASTPWWRDPKWLEQTLRTRRSLAPLKCFVLWAWAFEDVDPDNAAAVFAATLASHHPVFEKEQFLLWPDLWTHEHSSSVVQRVVAAMNESTTLQEVQSRLGVGHMVLYKWLQQHQALQDWWKTRRWRSKRAAALNALNEFVELNPHARMKDVHRACLAPLRWLQRNDPGQHLRFLESLPSDRSVQRSLV